MLLGEPGDESLLGAVTLEILGPADPQGLPVLRLPYLVLMKVQAGRTQDLADAARMLGGASEEDRRATREVFRRWLPHAVDDLESLIRLGEPEMGGGS